MLSFFKNSEKKICKLNTDDTQLWTMSGIQIQEDIALFLPKKNL